MRLGVGIRVWVRVSGHHLRAHTRHHQLGRAQTARIAAAAAAAAAAASTAAAAATAAAAVAATAAAEHELKVVVRDELHRAAGPRLSLGRAEPWR